MNLAWPVRTVKKGRRYNIINFLGGEMLTWTLGNLIKGLKSQDFEQRKRAESELVDGALPTAGDASIIPS